MEPELLGIFRAELVVKDRDLGSLWTCFMHMRINEKPLELVVSLIYVVLETS